MSRTETISQVAARNPRVGVAVATENATSAVLAGLHTGDTGTAALLGALSGQALADDQRLATLIPILGQNVSTA